MLEFGAGFVVGVEDVGFRWGKWLGAVSGSPGSILKGFWLILEAKVLLGLWA